MNFDSLFTASDTVRMQAGGTSIFSKLYDAATAGVAGTVVSGFASLYNTGADLGNWLGADVEKMDVSTALGKLDSDWKNYYDENKEVIDTLGFAVGSIAPGGLALKAFNMWRTGASIGRARSIFGYTLNQQQKFTNAGLETMAKYGNDVYSTINSNKLKAMAFGAADQVLQTAVFETAAALALKNNSPTLANEQWADVAWDITKTSLVGGAIGGGISALWTNRLFKDASAAIDGKLRSYDTVVAAKQLNLTFGERAFSILDGMMKLPEEVVGADRKISFSYKLNGKQVPLELEVGNLADAALQKNVKRSFEEFQASIANAVADDTSVGLPVAKALLEMYGDVVKAGGDSTAVRNKLLGTLGNLKGIQSLGSAPVDLTKDVFYLTPGASLRGTRAENAAELFSSVRASNKDVGYRVVGDIGAGKYATLGTGEAPSTVAEAWKKGFDIVFSGVEGKIHINPGSTIFKKVGAGDDQLLRLAFNTRTKQTTDVPVATIADVTAKGAPTVTTSGVTGGKFTFAFSVGNFQPTLDSIQNSARHLWASGLNNLDHAVVDSTDFSLMERLIQLSADHNNFPIGVSIRRGDELIKLEELATDSLREMVSGEKLAELQRLLNLAKTSGEAPDVRLLAYRLNVEPSWIEKAIAEEFKPTKLLHSPDATRELKSYNSRDHVVLTYEKPPIADGVTPEFADAYAVYNAKKLAALEQTRTAAAAVLGEHDAKLLDLDPSQLSGKFQATGAGPTGFGFSNANYNDPARVWAQDTGRALHLIQQEFRNKALGDIQPKLVPLVANNNQELGAVLAMGRKSSVGLTLFGDKIVDFGSFKRYAALNEKAMAGKISPEEATQLQRFTFKVEHQLSPELAEFMQAYHTGHKRWLNNHTTLAAASGKTVHWDSDVLYFPPIDTKRVPFFAFVRQRDGVAFGTSEVTMVTAKNSDELARLTREIETEFPQLEIIYKDGSERFHKAAGDYEFGSGLNSPTIDSALKKAGKLSDFIPVMDAQAVAEQFIHHVARREDALARNAVQVRYAQTFEELDWLSKQYTEISRSKFQFLGKQDTQKVTDPFGDYKRLALNISPKAKYRLWSELNEFVDHLGVRAYATVESGWRSAQAGKTTWEDANANLAKFGLPEVFKTQQDYLLRQSGSDRSLVKLAVSKGNMLLANVALRLDTANALINVLSAPITMGMEVAAIRNSLKRDPGLLSAFEKTLTLDVPDTGLKIPGTARLIAAAMGNFFGAEKRALMERYTKTVGSVRSDLSLMHDMLEDVTLTPNLAPKKWAANIDKWTDKAVEAGATFTGNNFAESFTRFIASDVMRQITDPVVQAGKMSIKEQNSMIAIFTNRVQGNYIASQRPVAFQGSVGAAISLFQTYQFNLYQQLFRHIEDRNGRALAVGAALQSSLFGLSGMPMFDAINTHLIGSANINEGHKDAYSLVASANKQVGDFFMYGALSAFPMFSDQSPALYTRGDLNPRHLTILPTDPASLPIVEAGKRAVSAVWGLGNQIANGGELSSSLLHALEHNGISRPLAGLVQVLQGRSTTNSGAIMSAHNDLASIATVARLIGAKPMDESVAYNHMYRLNAYKAADRERLEKLGTPVKTKIASGELTEDDILDFASRYAAVGGRVENYGRALQNWMKDANESEVNTLIRAHRTSYAQRLFEIMGGDPLPDLYNSPAETNALSQQE